MAARAWTVRTGEARRGGEGATWTVDALIVVEDLTSLGKKTSLPGSCSRASRAGDGSVRTHLQVGGRAGGGDGE